VYSIHREYIGDLRNLIRVLHNLRAERPRPGKFPLRILYEQIATV